MYDLQEISRRLEEQAKAYQTSKFGRRFEGACLSKINLPESDTLKLNNYLKKPKNFLLFLGNPGIGKTYFCSALVPFIMRKGFYLQYWHEDDLFKKLRSTIRDGNDEYLSCLNRMTDCDFVIIDDLGTNKPNEWREEIIYELIDSRYRSMLPTIFTSNLSKEEFQDIYHPRIISRLFARENTILFSDAEDLRKGGL